MFQNIARNLLFPLPPKFRNVNNRRENKILQSSSKKISMDDEDNVKIQCFFVKKYVTQKHFCQPDLTQKNSFSFLLSSEFCFKRIRITTASFCEIRNLFLTFSKNP